MPRTLSWRSPRTAVASRRRQPRHVQHPGRAVPQWRVCQDILQLFADTFDLKLVVHVDENRAAQMKACLLNGVEIAVGGSKKNRIAGNRRRRKNSANRQHLLQADHYVIVKIVSEYSFIFWRALLICQSRTVLLGGTRLEIPGELLCGEIHGEQAALMGTQIHHVAHDGG